MPKFNKSFWKWFGDSKVVDAHGNPLVVYHGTPDVRGIFADGFKPIKSWRGSVFFAAQNYDAANSYADDHRSLDYQAAEPHVIPLYLSIKNPMMVNGKGLPWSNTEKYIANAVEAGNDGLIIVNTKDFYCSSNERRTPATTVFAWFNPRQAKVALDAPLVSRVDKAELGGTGPNDGTWDADDPDIRSNPDLEAEARRILARLK